MPTTFVQDKLDLLDSVITGDLFPGWDIWMVHFYPFSGGHGSEDFIAPDYYRHFHRQSVYCHRFLSLKMEEYGNSSGYLQAKGSYVGPEPEGWDKLRFSAGIIFTAMAIQFCLAAALRRPNT